MDLTKKRKLDDNGLVLTDFNLSLEDARKIIEPLTHDQLLQIVQKAVVRHPDVLDAVRSVADKDPALRKLFIRGLGWDTTDATLHSLFSTYGEVDEAVAILDKTTGKSKGFGFVTFKHVDGALRALKEPSKKIDGRMTVTNFASAGSGGPIVKPQAVDVSERKIYVANVPYDMPGEKLLAHFLSYGEIEEGPLGFDKATGKSRGYALFVYKTADSARASLVDPIKNVDGHQLNCKLAIDGKRGKVAGTGVPAAELQQGNGIGLQQTGAMPASVAPAQYGGQPGGTGGITAYGGVGGYLGGLQGPLPLSQQHPLNQSFSNAGVGGPGLSSLASQAQASAVGGGTYSASHYGGPGSGGYGGLVSAGGGLGGVAGGLGGAGGGLGLGGAGLGNAGAGFGGVGAFAGMASAGAGLGGSGPGLTGVGAGLVSAGAGTSLGGVGAFAGLGGAGAGLGGGASGLGGHGRAPSLYGLQPSSAGIASGGYSDGAHYSLSGGSGYQGLHHQKTGASPAPRHPPYY